MLLEKEYPSAKNIIKIPLYISHKHRPLQWIRDPHRNTSRYNLIRISDLETWSQMNFRVGRVA